MSNFLQYDTRIPHPYDSNPNWQQDGACRNHPTSLFFPKRGAPLAEIDKAKAICRVCPIRQACLDYALYHHETHGIWGGLSEKERRNLRRTQGIRPGPKTKTIIRLPNKPVNTDRCGTSVGYQRHFRAGEQPCEPCRQARNEESRNNIRKIREAARQRKQSLRSDEQR